MFSPVPNLIEIGIKCCVVKVSCVMADARYFTNQNKVYLIIIIEQKSTNKVRPLPPLPNVNHLKI